MSRKYYLSGKTTVRVRRTDSTGSEHDEFICDARDFKTAETIREALDLKEENRQTDDED